MISKSQWFSSLCLRRSGATSLLLWLLALCIIVVAVEETNGRAAEPPADGKRIYEQKCAACHGADGRGVKDQYEQPLMGDRSLGQLTPYIVETMPEDDPASVIGDDARAVAAYIYDTFYSDLAQERLRPARIELSHLTNRQYENAITDLIGQFEQFGWPPEQRGLSGEYFNHKDFRRDKRVIERVDPVVNFDFGKTTPDAEKFDADAYAIKWHGGVIPAETGDYEFTIETQNGANLFVNSYESALIDARVKSGDETEYRGSLRLIGGRVYPLMVELYASKDEAASIRLKWKPPRQAEQLVPERALTPDWTGRVFVLDTPFPPDDRSTGYERGTSISKAWHEATTRAALEVAGYVTDNLRKIAGVKRDDEKRTDKLRDFCRKFTERAFRHPLTDEERHFYVDAQFEGAANPETAVKQVVILTLTSPRFLYREAKLGPFDDFATASWLSFTLWDSLPDDALWKAAAQGELSNAEAVAAHARRMIDHPRTKSKLREFFHQWLTVDRFHEFAKDPQRFPQFDEAMISDLRTSLDLFLEDVVWGDGSDFRQLLLSESVFLNESLAAFYGDSDVAGDAFEKVSLESEGRAGVLSHPFLMAGFAYDDATSPIHRGVFLARSLLGRTLKPPPMAVAPTPAELAPEMTTRERVAAQTAPAACQTCHRMINPLGFSMENFDAIGRFRKDDEGRPVDATGSYITLDGSEVTFHGVRELAAFLANSEESQRAFVEQLFQFLVKQPIRAFGPTMLDDLHRSFVEQNFDIRKLLAEIAARSALKARDSPSEP